MSGKILYFEFAKDAPRGPRGTVWVLPSAEMHGSWGVHHVSEHGDHGAYYGSYFSFDEAESVAKDIAKRLNASVLL